MAKPVMPEPGNEPTDVPAPAPPVRIKCRQTGFEATIPAADWRAYTKDQRAAYAVLDDKG